MSRLLDDLLATARKRSAAFVDREVDLAGLTRTVTEEYALLASERALRLDLRLSSGPPTFVIWLPERAVAGAPERTANPPDLDPLRA